MDTPILDMLKAYKSKNRICFSMPGHKNGVGLASDFSSFSLDVTELEDTDNLYAPGQAIAKAMSSASELFSSDKTFFLVNGSTIGIHIMLAAVCCFGDTVLLSRTCHSSVINACSLLGIMPVFIEQEIMEDFFIPGGIAVKAVEKLIKKHEPKAVLITSPNYFGICSDILSLSELVHSYNIPLLVDEAHGAHFCVDSSLFPLSAMAQGADMSVQSAHKTLNAVNQTAFLQYKKGIVSYERVYAIYSMLQTSSPSYLLLASLDYARAELSKNGKNMWGATKKNVKEITQKLSKYYKILNDTYINRYNICDIDTTRIVINFSQYPFTGFEAAKKLREEYNIDVEMSDISNIVLIATPANTKKDYEALLSALLLIAKEKKEIIDIAKPLPLPKITNKISPFKAFHSNTKAYDMENCENRISARTIVTYPPAVPAAIPGSIITADTVSYLMSQREAGANICGTDSNGKIITVE